MLTDTHDDSISNSGRIFRLFISSTFEDFRDERECLQLQVFPVLAEMCRSFGAVFQPIDLRWGVSDEAGYDHRTLEICLTEIDRCLAQTVRPNFLVMLGSRYGWQPLPSVIDSGLFLQLLEANADPADAELLTCWYVVDDNHMPPLQVLRPREGSMRDPARWAEVEVALRAALQRCTEAMHPHSDTRLQRLSWSATHHEVERGVLQGVRQGAGVVAFIRDDPAAASAQQAQLVQQVEQRVSATQCLRLAPEVDREAYHAQFCSGIRERLENAVRAQLAQVQVDPLRTEAATHCVQRQRRSGVFVGREGEIEALLQAARSSKCMRAGSIALVEGPSGTGKSALLSQLVDGLALETRPPLVIERYIGATVESTSPLGLLLSVNAELRRALGEPEPEQSTVSVRGAVADLQRLLSDVAATRPVVLLLDALDQMLSHPGAEWIPDTVPAGCLLVVSVLAGSRAARDMAVRIVDLQISLGPLPAAQAIALLQARLAAASRRLDPAQNQEMRRALSAGATALDVQVVVQIVQRWRSGESAGPLADDAASRLQQLLMWLEEDAQHGPVLPAAAFGLIGASRYGLSEPELIDLLSHDTQVMEDFRRRYPYAPPVSRLPQSVFSRLVNDLGSLMTSGLADGVVVHRVFHRLVHDACIHRYLDARRAAQRHRQLADYFGSQPDRYAAAIPGEVGNVNLRRMSEVVYQLLAAGDANGAATLLADFGYLICRLETNRVDELAAEVATACRMLAVAPKSLEQVARCLARHAGLLRRGNLRWPAHRILLQLLSDRSGTTGLEHAARSWLQAGHVHWHWLRRSWTPANSGVIAEIHMAGTRLRAVTALSGTRLLGVSEDGWCQCWDWSCGQLTASTRIPGNAVLWLAPDRSALRCEAGPVVTTLDTGDLQLVEDHEMRWEPWQRPGVQEDPFQSLLADGWTVERETTARYLHQSKDPFHGLKFTREEAGAKQVRSLYGLPANVDGLQVLDGDRFLVWTEDGIVQVWSLAAIGDLAEPAPPGDGGAAASLCAGALLLPDMTVATWAPAPTRVSTVRFRDLETAETIGEAALVPQDDLDKKGVAMSKWVTGCADIDGLLLCWGRSEAVALWHPESSRSLAEVRLPGQFEVLSSTHFWFEPSSGKRVPEREHDAQAGHHLAVLLLTSHGYACFFDAHANQGFVFGQGRQTADPTANYARRYEHYGFDVLDDGRVAMRWRDDPPRVWHLAALLSQGTRAQSLVLETPSACVPQPPGARHSQNEAIQVSRVCALSGGGYLVQVGGGQLVVDGDAGRACFEVDSEGFAEEILPGFLLAVGPGEGDQPGTLRLSYWNIRTGQRQASSAPLPYRIVRATPFADDCFLTIDAGRVATQWDRTTLTQRERHALSDLPDARPDWMQVLRSSDGRADACLSWNAWIGDGMVGAECAIGGSEAAQAIWQGNGRYQLAGLEADGSLLCLSTNGEAFALELMHGGERTGFGPTGARGDALLSDPAVAQALAMRHLQRAKTAASLRRTDLAAADRDAAAGKMRWAER